MEVRVGELVMEVTRTPSPKFAAPLLLVHGLWCTADVWRRWVGFLAHRGWSCHALNLRGRLGAPRAEKLADYEEDICRAVAGMEAPPVIIGHDLGGLLALRVAARACAVVALAPWVPPASGGLLGAWGTLKLSLRRVLSAPRGSRGRAYWGDPKLSLVAEPTAIVRTLFSETISLPATSTPTLLVAGGRDQFVPRISVERVSQDIGAALLVDEEAGHPLAVEAGWERRVGRVHRWIVQGLGDPLLLLREESEHE